MITKTIALTVTGNDEATINDAIEEACIEMRAGVKNSGLVRSGENDGGSYKFTVTA